MTEEAPDQERSPELLAELHRRSHAYIRIWLKARKRGDDCRATIRECAAVDNIIAAVVSARRGKPLPRQPNPRRLRKDIDRGAREYRTRVDMSPTQPWAAEIRRGEELVKLFRKLREKLTPLLTRDTRSERWDDALGRRWMKRLAPASIDFVAEIMRLEERVSRELEFSFTVAADPSTLQDIFFALWPASALLGSESPQAWLFGMYLAKVFEREFGLKTDMNKAKSSNGKNRITNMPYIAFVQAVLADMKIADSGSPAPGTIYHHVKQVKPKKEK